MQAGPVVTEGGESSGSSAQGVQEEAPGALIVPALQGVQDSEAAPPGPAAGPPRPVVPYQVPTMKLGELIELESSRDISRWPRRRPGVVVDSDFPSRRRPHLIAAYFFSEIDKAFMQVAVQAAEQAVVRARYRLRDAEGAPPKLVQDVQLAQAQLRAAELELELERARAELQRVRGELALVHEEYRVPAERRRTGFISALIVTAQHGFARDVDPFLALCKETWGEEVLWDAVKDLPHGRVRQEGPSVRDATEPFGFDRGPFSAGRTRLMYAAMCGDEERVRWLLARGARPELRLEGADSSGLGILFVSLFWGSGQADARCRCGNLRYTDMILRDQDLIL